MILTRLYYIFFELSILYVGLFRFLDDIIELMVFSILVIFNEGDGVNRSLCLWKMVVDCIGIKCRGC